MIQDKNGTLSRTEFIEFISGEPESALAHEKFIQHFHELDSKAKLSTGTPKKDYTAEAKRLLKKSVVATHQNLKTPPVKTTAGRRPSDLHI